MHRSLRIAVADDEPRMVQYLRKILPRLGHEVIAEASNGKELIDKCLSLHPDLVITDIKMPEIDGLAAAEEIYQKELVPVVIISAYHDGALIDQAKENHVLAYLIKPIRESDLIAAIAIAMARFAEFQELRKEAISLRQALEDRKVIERAKGILMRKAALNEQDAFRRLQGISAEKNLKLVDVARAILMTEEILARLSHEGNGH